MKIAAKITERFENQGKLKAFATLCLNGTFLVTGVRVVDCEKGLMVFMPSRKTDDGEYKDVCFPITSELHKKIKDTVLAAYAVQPEDEPEEPDIEEPPQGA
jgi:stage V sporulation protein G